MMLDADVVAVSPNSVYRVLTEAGVLRRWAREPSKKGTGFEHPTKPHEHWRTDVTYINILGTFYYLCSLLDGYSRCVVHWEVRASMTKADVEVILLSARENFPEARPWIVSDNSPQFVARDFKEFIRLCGMTHVRTSPYYPLGNGKIEAWHKWLKIECIRPGKSLSLEDARRIVSRFVEYFNNERLHSAIGYVAPQDKLEGCAAAIFAERDRKMEKAGERRSLSRRPALMEVRVSGAPAVEERVAA